MILSTFTVAIVRRQFVALVAMALERSYRILAARIVRAHVTVEALALVQIWKIWTKIFLIGRILDDK